MDDALSVFAIQGADLKIWREAEQNIFLYNGLRSLYADEIGMDDETMEKVFCTIDPVTLKTVVRANPGVFVVQNGIIIDKYNLRNK